MTATASSGFNSAGSKSKRAGIRLGQPDGPKLPVALQTLIYFTAWPQLMRYCRTKYGPVFTLGIMKRSPVVITDVEEIRKLFSGSPQAFHAGEGNRVLRPIVGSQSLLILNRRHG